MTHTDQPQVGTNWIQDVGKPAYESICEMVSALKAASGDCESQEDSLARITDDPLSVRVFGVRCDGEWEPTSYEILLSTGGPAVRIVGELTPQGEPTSARLQVQDWFKPWAEYHEAEEAVLMTYVECFYFGE